MNRRFIVVFSVVFMFSFMVSCATAQVQEDHAGEKKVKEVEEVEKVEKVETDKDDAEDFGETGNIFINWCRNEITEIEKIVEKIKNDKDNKSADEILKYSNELETKQTDVSCSASINQFNHPDEGMRKAAQTCTMELSAQSTRLSLDKDLYNVFAGISVEDESLTDEDRYYLKDVIVDFKRNGVDKDDKTRARLQELSSELTDLYQKFYSNIAADKKEIVVSDPEKLKGLPEDFISQKKPDKDGNIILTTDWPDYLPVIESAENAELREEMFRAKRGIAFPANTEIFAQIHKLRTEWAQILDFANWAEYSQAKLMIENPENAQNFIEKILELAAPYVEKEKEIFLQYIQKDNPEATDFEPWDRIYYQNLVKKDKYDFDSQEVRKYFEISKVMDGVFKVVSKIYGVDIKKVERDDVWHESVESYDVMENGKVIGHFDLDMYPRPDKYKHFAMFTNRAGVKGVRPPRGAIIGNFPQPVDGKAYLSHHDVETIFHEFGHLLHMIFGAQKYVRFSGTRCQRDFVEVPSHLFEEWVWDASILQLFATDDEGNPIPEELVEKMKNASEFGNGVHITRQMYLAMLSLGIYREDPANFDHRVYEKEIERKYSPTVTHDDIAMVESFGHLIGYSSNYYTYMWSMVIAKDMLSKIRETNLMDPEIMGKFRDEVLNVGGAKNGNRIINDFLGRELSFEAFEEWISN
jgi:thimet oligopeptidase